MASPCQVLMEVDDRQEAERILSVVVSEVERIEAKFSRYRSDSIVQRINESAGSSVEVDDETGRLLDYAGQLYRISGGRFDVTSGVLRRVWRFDGGSVVPDDAAVRAAVRDVGWPRVTWDGRRVRLEPRMELDFGGFGKEYAADRAALRVAGTSDASCLVNLGGDLVVTRPRRRPWIVGIERPDTVQPTAARLIRLKAGALATSGDAKRYVVKDGVRYMHILDPTTGWPVQGAPRSVTVAAGNCLDAGMLATLAMLQGPEAESFLGAQQVQHWVLR
jgi:thiamine biosynthesis lipoprotein